MASRIRRALLLIASLALAAGATAIARAAERDRQASACRHFGTTEAPKLSHREASRSIGCLINRARHGTACGT